MDQSHDTWPAASDSFHFSALPLSKSPHQDDDDDDDEPQKRRFKSRSIARSSSSSSFSDSSSGAPERDFSALPFDLLVRIAAAFNVPNLWAASMVCSSWKEALRPLREAMLLVRWGKRFKHGRGGVRPNIEKALESFLKGAARGSAPAMVDAGLIYWETGRKEKGIAMYKKAAALGDPAGLCNLGISHLHGISSLSLSLLNCCEVFCNLHLVEV